MAPNRKDKVEMANLRSEVEQLRREKSVERKKVSEATEKLLAYVQENTREEQLLREHKNFRGLVEPRENPWKKETKKYFCFLF